jgi:hypothetical protein
MNDPITIRAADYWTGSKRKPATVDLYEIRGGRRGDAETIVVSGKGEARRIAKERGFKPWNF